MPQHPQDSADPVAIWRYMSVEKFLAVLSDRALYFARLESLLDIYEGHCRVLKFEPDGSEISASEKAISEVSIHLEATLPDTVKGRVYVNCWFAANDESELMWHRYAHSGIAIRSTSQRFLAALDRDALEDKRQFRFEPVHYSENILAEHRNTFDMRGGVVSLDYNDWMRPAFVKASYYMQESEWRAAVYTDYQSTEGSSGIQLPVDIERLIEAVYVSPFAPSYLATTLRSILLRLQVDVAVCPSKISIRLH